MIEIDNPLGEDERIAVIGCGNMGSALVRGFCEELFEGGSRVTVFDRSESVGEELHESLGVEVANSAAKAATKASVVILAVKPNDLPDLLKEIAPAISKRKKSPPLIVSIASGVSVEKIQKTLDGHARIARVMPNLPCIIGLGASGIYSASQEDVSILLALFSAVGLSVALDKEEQLDVVTALSGSGPGYILLVIEALSDAAVRLGLNRDEAQILAAQTTLGAAALALQSEEHPAELRDMVSSPGGTTIAGLYELEKGGVRAAFSSAVDAALKRARDLRKGGK